MLQAELDELRSKAEALIKLHLAALPEIVFWTEEVDEDVDAYDLLHELPGIYIADRRGHIQYYRIIRLFRNEDGELHFEGFSIDNDDNISDDIELIGTPSLCLLADLISSGKYKT